MFLRYGVTGVRGEAESGFATVRLFALPVYRTRREAGVSVNDALCDTLLVLIASNMDTNILGRHDMETLRYAQRAARNVAMLDGMHTEAGCRAIRVLDDDFTQRWISPGGSADLLAVTHFSTRSSIAWGRACPPGRCPVSANGLLDGCLTSSTTSWSPFSVRGEAKNAVPDLGQHFCVLWLLRI